MYLRITHNYNGTIETQTFLSETDAMHLGHHLMSCIDVEDYHDEIMWTLVTDLTSGNLCGLWRLTDHGFIPVDLNHAL